MNRSRRTIVVAAILVLGLAGCAGTPPVRTPAATGAATVAPSAATEKASAPQSVARQDENPFPGYTRRKASNGETLYCREDEVVGTRIPTLVCATEDVMRNSPVEARQQVEDIRQTAGQGGCNPSAGC